MIIYYKWNSAVTTGDIVIKIMPIKINALRADVQNIA